MNNVIKFYSASSDYGEFSNFKTGYPINLKRKTWPTTEHYFQAQKFLSPKDQNEILRAKKAFDAARMGRSRKRKIRKDWEAVKEGVMLEALMAKFTQHPTLGELLKSTGDAKLVEHTSNDSYWGDGGDGSGKNRLGYLLMQVRESI